MASSEPQGSSILAFEEIPASDVSCAVIEPSDVYEWIEHTKPAGDHARKDFLLVDVRRNDWEGGTIATSVNLPAQSFYPTRSGVYQLCKQAGIKKVIFYCGWFQDYLNSIGETDMTAAILKGGVKGWQKTYNGQNMDHYDPNAWGSQSK
ncbi:hypothetical protein A0O28_0027840 [Trichoderma guizhouense]|uniref:Rhodanese domain-containing protein n=1 Tax=Trichoderma guizhouense TaxID=1491466 RepID=A0A1T3CTZ1_9HYPO|nr:hypothetical protein A0O28_0027840 [Trichoderma guizhouense]